MKTLNLKVGKYDLSVAAEDSGDGKQWVALKPLCEALGLAYQVQHRKVSSNPQFNHHHMVTVGEDGKDREMLMIPVRAIGAWVCGINANRVKPELKERLLECQFELQAVLHDALTGEVTSAKFYALEQRFAQALRIMEEQGKQLSELLSEKKARSIIENAEKSAAGTLLVSHRWADRARQKVG